LRHLSIHLASIAPLEFYRGEQPSLPALEMLTCHGSAVPFTLVGDSAIFETVAQGNISFAQQRLAGEQRQPENLDSGFWYCADPVYLQADRDQVLLTHPISIQIKNSEADALIEAFNQLFKEDGVELWRAMSEGIEEGDGSAERWYLRSERPWLLSTTSLDHAENQSIRELLPQGEDALRWSKLISEVEMLFFANPINQQRSERRAPLISGIWLWGEQKVESRNATPWSILLGEHPLLKGACSLSGVAQVGLPDLLEEVINTQSNTLIVVDELLQQQRTGAHHEIPPLLQALEQTLFAPALAALKQGKIDQFSIQPANGEAYKIKRRDLMRFWRRSKPVWHEV